MSIGLPILWINVKQFRFCCNGVPKSWWWIPPFSESKSPAISEAIKFTTFLVWTALTALAQRELIRKSSLTVAFLDNCYCAVINWNSHSISSFQYRVLYNSHKIVYDWCLTGILNAKLWLTFSTKKIWVCYENSEFGFKWTENRPKYWKLLHNIVFNSNLLFKGLNFKKKIQWYFVVIMFKFWKTFGHDSDRI